jgi:hypothetical protein
MNAPLSTTGTAALLEQLSDFIPDSFINELLPPHKGRGRRQVWSAAQLFRLQLLVLLTPARSFNLLVELLPEQRAWRRFARLPNRRSVPTVFTLHDFRVRLSVGVLRRIHRHLLEPLLEGFPSERTSVALIDSTDLPAATSAFKKS